MKLNQLLQEGIISGSYQHLPFEFDCPDSLKLKRTVAGWPFDQGEFPWRGERLVYLGRRYDGYDFFGYIGENGDHRILAGCRDRTVAEAEEHWDGQSHRCQESLAMVRHFKNMADIRKQHWGLTSHIEEETFHPEPEMRKAEPEDLGASFG